MSFVVDGADWRFDGMADTEISATLDRFLDFVDLAAVRGEAVQIGDDLQRRVMIGDLSLWDMFSPGSGLSLAGELRQELAAWLGPVEYYADAERWPDGADDVRIAIGAEPAEDNADVAWVHHSVRAGQRIACLALRKSAVFETVSAAGRATVYFVADEAARRAFWRDAVERDGDDVASLTRYATHAWPDLLFVDGVLADADGLDGGYRASSERVRRTLSVLDDHGAWAFGWPPPAIGLDEGPPPDPDARPTNQLIEKRFAGFGLIAAPEKPNVRADRVSREAREVRLGGRTLYCEWHAKLQLHRNRIHFHPPVPESGGKVVVGVIHEHLPLP